MFPELFPDLSPENHRVTSPRTRRYNCIAWALERDSQWWWPDPDDICHWPPGVPREETVAAFLAAFATLGYTECPDGDPEPGHEKLALFATADDNGALVPTHAARQLANGRWTSKLGAGVDIEHDGVSDVEGPLYGSVVRFARRAR